MWQKRVSQDDRARRATSISRHFFRTHPLTGNLSRGSHKESAASGCQKETTMSNATVTAASIAAEIVSQMSEDDRASFVAEAWEGGIAAMLVEEWEAADLDEVIAAIEEQLCPLRTTDNGDGTVTYWDVYRQQWQTRRAERVGSDVLATLSERDRQIIESAAAAEWEV